MARLGGGKVAPEAQIYGNSRLFTVIRVPSIIAPQARPIYDNCCPIAGNCCFKIKYLRSFTVIHGHLRSAKQSAGGANLR